MFPSDMYGLHRPIPDDFDVFWDRTLAESPARPELTTVEPVPTALRTVDVFAVTFAGYGGHPISAWWLVPSGAQGPMPVVVQFAGYREATPSPLPHTLWPSAGFGLLVVDTRGQGMRTPDPVGSTGHEPGFLTKGIDSPDSYYYRRVFTDAVRAVDAAAALPGVGGAPVSVLGGSQGGAIALAAASLHGRVASAAVFVPFLSGIALAAVTSKAEPYQELVRFGNARPAAVTERALDTLAYFDGAHLATRCTAPVYMTAGLQDEICPAACVAEAYGALAGPKTFVTWPFGGHEVHDEDVSGAIALFTTGELPAGSR